MSWTITGAQPIPAVIGEPFGGGYFAGYISHTADGNPTHALIVAPRATGATGSGYTLTTNLQWKTANTTTAGTTSAFDGAANTAAMVTAGIADHPAANFCKNLSIGGFTDWYLPATNELEIAYFNLKPTLASNIGGGGINSYAVPSRLVPWSTSYPSRTNLALFVAGGGQDFVDNFHYASTEASQNNGFTGRFSDGFFASAAGIFNKNQTTRVRAFRRIAL